MRNFQSHVVLSLVASVSWGCPPGGAAWLGSASGPWRPEFGVATQLGGDQSVGPTALIVAECAANGAPIVVWHIVPDAEMPPLPTRVRYGAAPEGYSTLVGAEPLHARCYHVSTKGTAELKFELDAYGRATSLE